MIIEVSNLVKKYKDLTAVNGLTIDVAEGEIFGLLGPNGAGKSTTMNVMLGLLKYSSGTIKMYGKEFSENSKEIKRKIGYVPQDFAFFETLSAVDNVNYWGKIYGLRGAKLEKAAKEALEFTGLWDRRKDKANSFSGGMKRRLNIACAIVHNPEILFMDEPTVGVDPQSRNNILESIKEMNRRGTTIIYTSHYMEEIEALCDRVTIMDLGRNIASGTVEELIDSISEDTRLWLELSNCSEKTEKIITAVEGIIECKRKENAYQVRTKKDGRYLSELLEKIISNDIKILSLVLEKPNLETVFLQLTGKKLRD